MNKQGALVPTEEPQTQALTQTPVEVFERLARDPNMDVEKFERLMAMYERASARVSEERFNAAMSAAQEEMKPVSKDASNPQTHSRYASYEALDRAIRPLYTKHGFGLSFNTGDSPTPDMVRVVCKVTHRDGHAELYKIDMPADGKGAKGGDVMTKTHATGSAVSYGQRYLLKMVFNVATGEKDDDGNKAGRTAPAQKEPSGFQNWLIDLQATADTGVVALREAYKKSRTEFRNYLEDVEPDEINRLSARAKKSDEKKAGEK